MSLRRELYRRQGTPLDVSSASASASADVSGIGTPAESELYWNREWYAINPLKSQQNLQLQLQTLQHSHGVLDSASPDGLNTPADPTGAAAASPNMPAIRTWIRTATAPVQDCETPSTDCRIELSACTYTDVVVNAPHGLPLPPAAAENGPSGAHSAAGSDKDAGNGTGANAPGSTVNASSSTDDLKAAVSVGGLEDGADANTLFGSSA